MNKAGKRNASSYNVFAAQGPAIARTLPCKQRRHTFGGKFR
jgi:hypothetical protein